MKDDNCFFFLVEIEFHFQLTVASNIFQYIYEVNGNKVLSLSPSPPTKNGEGLTYQEPALRGKLRGSLTHKQPFN